MDATLVAAQRNCVEDKHRNSASQYNQLNEDHGRKRGALILQIIDVLDIELETSQDQVALQALLYKCKKITLCFSIPLVQTRKVPSLLIKIPEDI